MRDCRMLLTLWGSQMGCPPEDIAHMSMACATAQGISSYMVAFIFCLMPHGVFPAFHAAPRLAC